jgi:hypothetical protein
VAIDELSIKMGRLEEEISKMRISKEKKIELLSMMCMGNAYGYCEKVSAVRQRRGYQLIR